MALRELAISFALGAGSAAPAVIASQQGTFDVAGTYTRVAAEAPCPIDPRDLAAIQSVESPSAVVDETGLVSNPDGLPVRGDGGHSAGPFQFYELAGTWAAYGNGGDPDRLPDAAAATARMLCANNYNKDRWAAIKRHNGSGPMADAYAARVVAAANEMPPITAPPAAPVAEACETEPGRGLAQVAGRAWCNLVVEPWLSVGARSEGTAWGRIDGWVFGNDTPPAAAPSGQRDDAKAGITTALAGLAGSEGMQPYFATRLRDLAQAAPGAVTITSGYRSTAEQVAIIESHGGECGYMVACVRDGVCGSQHCAGLAADLFFGDDATKAWVQANAERFGLRQCMSWEDWHYSPSDVCDSV